MEHYIDNHQHYQILSLELSRCRRSTTSVRLLSSDCMPGLAFPSII